MKNSCFFSSVQKGKNSRWERPNQPLKERKRRKGRTLSKLELQNHPFGTPYPSASIFYLALRHHCIIIRNYRIRIPGKQARPLKKINDKPMLMNLTFREKEILYLIAMEKTNQEIARSALPESGDHPDPSQKHSAINLKRSTPLV